jgi:hypothetical protein
MRTTALAERFQVEEVKAALEDALFDQLSVGNCAEAFMGSRELELGRVEAAVERFVIARFEEVARPLSHTLARSHSPRSGPVHSSCSRHHSG